MAESRRTRLTKQMLKSALLELLKEAPIGRISVTAICDKADVHRSTFYAHYDDAMDLLYEIENDVFEKMPSHKDIPNLSELDKFSKLNAEFFDYIKDNVSLFKTLMISSDSMSFRNRLTEWLLDNYPWNDPTKDAEYNRFNRIYVTVGALGMLEEWIRTDFKLNSEEFSDLMLRIVLGK